MKLRIILEATSAEYADENGQETPETSAAIAQIDAGPIDVTCGDTVIQARIIGLDAAPDLA